MESSDVPPVEELYQTILERQHPVLPGFEDIFDERASQRAFKIHDYLLDRADRLDENCQLCWEKPSRKSHTRGVYETPWDANEVEKTFCSEEHAETYLSEDPFAYFWCEPCGRQICKQNPANGWMVQVKDYDGEEVCLSCYQDLILENGLERDKFEAGQIPGMFFSHGNPEPLDAGYTEVDGFDRFFVKGSDRVRQVRDKALELIDSGCKVVVGYENMAITGDEGFVSLFRKGN